MSNLSPAAVRRRKFAPLVMLLGVAASLALVFSMTGANSAFTASINNTTNSVGSGTLLLSETQGATTCLSSAAGTVTAANAGTCSTINKFGGNMAAKPGDSFTSTVVLANNGTVPASTFTLTPGGCTASANGAVNGTDTAGFCGKVNITINDDTNAKCVFPVSTTAACGAPTSTNTLSSLGTTAINLAAPLAPGATRSITFTVQLDPSATNAHQGLRAASSLTWAIAA